MYYIQKKRNKTLELLLREKKPIMDLWGRKPKPTNHLNEQLF